ncbi:ABC transporter ATP-binding protein [Enteractinococcus helveticum]|uniref:ABC transporter ATP-binding protein n=1 Tax=Enteractinococcus helveticum TaxID=1837282 RepID=A0A1B7LXJ5_9MICC|nr:ABC transporter ATP-binding protein [Enteractinococcus helveticum]OAV59895.1 ABC transporter ATP-binding protein [Enteractinococcus helveticum]
MQLAQHTKTAILHSSNLTKEFATTSRPTPVLNGIDLTIHSGEFVAIMGPSGSGKSTLLHLLSGLDDPSSGQIEFEQHSLHDLNDRQRSRLRLHRMGFIFQQPHFLKSLTIYDNVLLPALKAAPDSNAVQHCVDQLLHQFSIDHIAHQYASEVSGGQLQRAALCRALGTKPAMLFADEPTGALNSQMTQGVLDALAAAHTLGTTILMVTHDPVCAARADRIVYLRDGVVVDELTLNGSQHDAATRENTVRTWLSHQGF